MISNLKKINNRIIKISVNMVGVLISIILLVLLLGSIVYTAKFRSTIWTDYNEGLDFVKDNVFLNAIFVILFMGLLYFLSRVLSKINHKIILVISLLITGIIGLIWVNYIRVPVRADSKMVYTIALEFLDNSYDSLKESNYLGIHPMQIGIVYFIELFYKLVGNRSSLLFQNFNIILVVLCYLLLYKICFILYKDEKINKILELLLAFCIVMPLASVLVYGNIIGLFWSLLAIFLLLKYLDERKIKYLLLIIPTIVISIILKANYEIVLIAISIVLILDFLKEFKWINIVAILITLSLVKLSSPLLYLIAEKQSGMQVPTGTPMITYIAMGMYQPSDRAPGWYNAAFNVESVYINNNYDEEKTKIESEKVIKERLNYFKENPKEFFKYYLGKIGTTWFEPTYQTIWTSSPMEEVNDEIEEYYASQKLIPSMLSGKIANVIIKYLDVLEITVFMSSFGYVIWSLKNKSLEYKNIILIISFLGGFFFHILWETKSIYSLPFYFMLLPMASAGLSKLFEFIENVFLNKIRNDIKKEKQE